MCENHKDDQALMIEIGAVTAQLLTLQNENENSRKGTFLCVLYFFVESNASFWYVYFM